MTRTSPTSDTQGAVTARYGRIARFYDLIDRPMDVLGGVARRRRRLLRPLRDRTVRSCERRPGSGRSNRRTEDNIAQAGLDVVEIRRWGIWREIVVRP